MVRRSTYLYEFGPFRLDTAERLLSRDGEVVPLSPKAFDLLLAMVEHHGRLIKKDELMRLVWPDTFVEEANLSYTIALIRKALGDGGGQFIATVPKHGYRFTAEARRLHAGAGRRSQPSLWGAAADGRRDQAIFRPRRREPISCAARSERDGATRAWHWPNWKRAPQAMTAHSAITCAGCWPRSRRIRRCYRR